MTMPTENAFDLPQWSRPASYGGFSPDGDFVVYSQNRDSTILEQVNYERIMADLEKLAESLPMPDDGEPWVYDFRAGHWACGWVECLMVRQDAPEALQMAVYETLNALGDYPVYDEARYSEAQVHQIFEYWQRISISERIEWCREGGDSVFAARRDEIPEGAESAMLQSEAFY